jgi:hypothetical protein
MSLVFPIAAQAQDSSAAPENTWTSGLVPALRRVLTATRNDTRKLEVTTQLGAQTLTTDMSMDLHFSNSVALDNRMDGPVLSTAGQEPEISPGMTQAQQLAAMEKMLSSMDHTANWTEKPPEMGDDLAAVMQQHMDESAVPAYLEYHRVAVQGGLLNEFNRRYDMTMPLQPGRVRAGCFHRRNRVRGGRRGWRVPAGAAVHVPGHEHRDGYRES